MGHGKVLWLKDEKLCPFMEKPCITDLCMMYVPATGQGISGYCGMVPHPMGVEPMLKPPQELTYSISEDAKRQPLSELMEKRIKEIATGKTDL